MSETALETKQITCAGCRSIWTRWYAQCPKCGRFNSLSGSGIAGPAHTPAAHAPVIVASSAPQPSHVGFVRDNQPSEPEPATSRPVPITEIDDAIEDRIETGIEPLDRVLGGGLVIGGLVLIGGEPGAGKSSLTMQAAYGLATANRDAIIFYATGEESEAQVAMRARRLRAAHAHIMIVHESDVDTVIAHARDFPETPAVLIVDSISTMTTADVAGIAGSVSQVKECAKRIGEYARETGCTVILIGHVTRDGTIAGPRTLDHLVDVVLSLENAYDDDSGDATAIRYLRAHKNRSGDSLEVGAFEMTATGLVPSHHEPGDLAESLVPVMQEILVRFRALGGVIDEGLRDRIAGRLDCDDGAGPKMPESAGAFQET